VEAENFMIKNSRCS